MEYQQAGRSQLFISRIGFGCMSLQRDQKENEKIIHHAVDNGVNYFDTADIYDSGLNEASIGKALKGKRSKVIIATKGGNEPKPGGSGWNWNASKDYIIRAAEASLKRLKTDYIDLFQLHGGTIDDPIDETIEAFETLQKQGKIRFYGISSIRPNVIREYVERSGIVSVMMQYSLLDRRPEEECLQLLKDSNICVLARGSVAGGLLVDKPAKEYLGYSEDEVKKAADAIRWFSREGRTAAQTAIRFVLADPAVTAAVVGIRTMDQLKEAIGVINTPALTPPELEELKNTLTPNKYEHHR